MIKLYQFSLLYLIFIQHAHAGDFTCPQAGDNFDQDQTYSAMTEQSVWIKAGHGTVSPMVFVDGPWEGLVSDSGGLTPLGKTYINEETGRFDTRGTFKVGYDMTAKECRRKTTLTEEIKPGVWEGYTEIEICAPGVKKIFEELQATEFEPISQQLEVMAKALSDQVLKLNIQIDECEEKGRDNCDEIGTRKSDLYWKSQSLKNLARPPARGVEFYTNEQGAILPRFKVKIKKLWFERVTTDYLRKIKDSKACRLNVYHEAQYAGLISRYTWDLYYNHIHSLKLWSFDPQSGASVEIPKAYTSPIFIFKDQKLDFPRD